MNNLDLWPHLSVNQRGHLEMDGYDLCEVVKEYGTPLYVVSYNRLQERYAKFSNAFSQRYGRTLVFYSIKTNNNISICKAIQEAGGGAEVGSGLDLYVAKLAGFPPEKIIFSGLYKSDREIESSLQLGINSINVESFSELEVVDRLAEKTMSHHRIGIRVNMGTLANRFSVRNLMGMTYDRFGFDVHRAAFEAYQAASKLRNVDVVGIHTHLGSQISSARAFVKAAGKIAELAAKLKKELGIKLEYVNLGGGFGVPTVKIPQMQDFALDFLKSRIGHHTSKFIPQKVTDIESFAEDIVNSLKKNFQSHNLNNDYVLMLEPGRYIVSDAVLLLAKVHLVKEKPKWAVCDGGTNLLPTIRDWYQNHELVVANKATPNQLECLSIAGPLAYTSDILARDRLLPHLEQGDIVAVLSAGAYTMSIANQFLQPRAMAVMLKKKGIDVIKQRETYEDVVRGQT